MNIAVLFFFLHNVLATVLLGGKFFIRKDTALKNWGFALLLNAVAFAAWTFGILIPSNLLSTITFGAICFLISLIFMLRASTDSLTTHTRLLITTFGVLAVIGVFYVGNISPTSAYVSPEGLLFFNLTPVVQMLYVFALMLTALPAIEQVASKFRSGYGTLFRYGFIAEIAGAIILITSKDVQTLYIAGWIMGLVYFFLWTTFIFSKKAWSGAN